LGTITGFFFETIGQMKRTILLAGLLLLVLPDAYAVKTGFYYCVPMHAAHLIKHENGVVAETNIDISGVVQIIVISDKRIDISNNRSDASKLVNIVTNEMDGAILGRSETRHFYMNDILHYFYGSTDAVNTVAYAEDGMCRLFVH